MRVTVYMAATASLTINVEIPDDTSPEDVEEKAIEAAYEEMPGGICAQCSGWRQAWSREIDEWEPYDGEGGPVHITDR